MTVLAEHPADPDGEQRAPADSDAAGGLRCTRCGTRCEWGSVMACTMWPTGCKTGPGGPAPAVCWRCCDEDEQCDLVDAGCSTALAYRRGWR